MHILHVVSQVSSGGGSRAAIVLANYSARQGAFEHSILSLLPPSASGLALARQAGLPVVEAATLAQRQAAVSAADVVQVDFWNMPEVYAFLRSEWPPARLLLWLLVAGNTAPQLLTQEVASLADFIVAAGANSAELPILNGPGATPSRVIAAAPDFERLAGLEARPHDGFNIGYIGTVDFDKIHPDFVALHANVRAPGARVIVCGPGGAYPRLRRQAADLGIVERFDFRGVLADLRPTLSVLDIFGYPLRADNYSTAEMALREAMYAGVPPVVFPYGGAGRTVKHQVTGLVATDADDYRRAIEFLHQHPDERARLGRNAQAEARRAFGPESAAAHFNAVYESLMRGPKRERTWSGAARGGAQYFAESLGVLGADFAASLAAQDDEELLAAEARIAGASTLLASGGAGGILQYRNAYLGEAHLRLWAGLVMEKQGRPALAVAEFNAAARLGLRHWRLAWYRARAAEACGAWELAAASAVEALKSAPNCRPAQDLYQRVAEKARASARIK